jgi:hypothetical protein
MNTLVEPDDGRRKCLGRTTMNTTFARSPWLLVLVILLGAATTEAAVGVTEIPGKDGDGPVTEG